MKFFKTYQLEKALKEEREAYNRLQIEYDAELTKTADQARQIGVLEAKLREAESVIESQEKALKKTTEAIRDQTEADLILSTLRLLEILPSRSEKNAMREHEKLQQQYQPLNDLVNQQMHHGSPPHSSLAESLLGSGFLGR